MREEGLLKKLVAAHGVSGFEKNVRKIIEEEAAPYADEMTVDAIGKPHRPEKRNGRGK